MAAEPEVLNYGFAIVIDRTVVLRAKWSYKAGRMYTTSTDSGRRYRLPNIQDVWQSLEVVTT